jgi:DNA invertase Pin-like site-specific DNA recombinase
MGDAIAYIRVSSDDQADSGLGLEAQRQRIADYCRLKGLRLAEVFEDPGISGGKPLASRPAGSQLLDAAYKGKDLVIVAKLDRLFRSVADAASVIADFDKKGIRLVALSEGFDLRNPYGRAMAQMASVFAELERALIQERTRSAMDVKRSRGERISGHAPYGWDFGSGGLLMKNRREQRIIARMREFREDGMSYRGIATRLDREGIPPKRGRQWAHTTVKSILLREAP